ncbi:MAG: hypothetical protein ACYS9X_02145 [Planctomycetota bacterium]
MYNDVTGVYKNGSPHPGRATTSSGSAGSISAKSTSIRQGEVPDRDRPAVDEEDGARAAAGDREIGGARALDGDVRRDVREPGEGGPLRERDRACNAEVNDVVLAVGVRGVDGVAKGGVDNGLTVLLVDERVDRERRRARGAGRECKRDRRGANQAERLPATTGTPEMIEHHSPPVCRSGRPGATGAAGPLSPRAQARVY